MRDIIERENLSIFQAIMLSIFLYKLTNLMNLITTDNNWFLCTDTSSDNLKEYTITAWWQTWTAVDHTMLVWHKEQLKEIAWKDLGNTMQLIRLVPNMLNQINEANDMSDNFITAFLSAFALYQWYDETSHQSYYYIPKMTGERLETLIHQTEAFLQNNYLTIINAQKWWCTIDHDLSLNDTDRQKYSLAQFLAIALIYGKALIIKETLTAYKIQIPTHSYSIVELLDQLSEKMRWLSFVINSQHNSDQQVYEITTSDYDLLAYLRILHGDSMDVILKDKMLDLSKQICIQYAVSAEQKAMRWKIYEVRR